MILFDKNEQTFTCKLDALTERRKEIANTLQSFQEAIKAFTGGESIKADIQDFLALDKMDDVKTEIAKRWLENEKVTFPIDPRKAFEVIDTTEEMEAVMVAWKKVKGLSNDPMKYWSDTKVTFRPVPVTKAEEERIRKRCEVYVKSVETLSIIDALKKEVALINLANDRFNQGLTEHFLKEHKPYLFPFIQRKNENYTSPHLFELDLSYFLIHNEVKPVFDEIDVTL